MEFLTLETARQLGLVMVIFWVAYWLLRVFLFRPIFELLEERSREVEGAEEVHRKALAETEAAIDQQRAELAGVRAKARDRRDQLRREAQAQRQELLAQAKKAADQRLAEAQAELEKQVAEARTELDRRAAGLADEMASQLLERAS